MEATAVGDQIRILFTVGGGNRTVEGIRAVLQQAADKINSAAVRTPELITGGAERFDV